MASKEEKDKKKLVIEIEFEKEVSLSTKDWLRRTIQSLLIPTSPWGDPHKFKVSIKEQ